MKDPCVLFYSQDFLTGTMLMTNEQKGKYITLLCLQHQNGGLTEKDMMKICGEYDEDIFKKFDVVEGHYFNKRMVIESERRKKFVESRQKNLKKNDMDTHMDSHMEPLMEIRNKKYEIRNSKYENEEIKKGMFNEFRKEYPGTKRGNDIEFTNFIKKHSDWEDVLPLLMPRLNYQKEARQARKENKLFVPEWKNLQTWINQRCWEEQINTEE